MVETATVSVNGVLVAMKNIEKKGNEGRKRREI